MQDEKTLDLGALIGVIRRQVRLIVAVLLTVVAIALLVVLNLRPAYTATALVLIDTSHKDLLSTSDQVDSSLSDSARVDGEVELVKSRDALLDVVKTLDLINSPEFEPRLGFTDKLRMAIHLGAPTLPSGEQALDYVVGRVDDAVSVQRRGTTFLIQVSARTGDPALSARLANGVANSYISDQRQTKIDSVLASRDIIQSRLGDANKSVVSSEEAIDSFILTNFISIAQGTGKTQLIDIRNQLQQTESDETEKAARADKIAKGISSADWSQVAASLQSDAVASLERQREDLQNHLKGLAVDSNNVANLQSQLANVEGQLQQQATTQLSGLSNDISAEKSKSAELRSQLRDAAVSSDMPPALLANLYELQQNAQVARTQYQAMIARQKDLETEAYLQVADSRLASLATAPSVPSFPNTRLILLLAALAGLAIGVAAALLRENLIGGFVSLAQITAVLRVPAVSSVPWQRAPRDGGLKALSVADLMTSAPLSVFSESIRMIQVGVDQSLRRRRGRAPAVEPGGAIIMVSSAGPGEGKTTIALSLARAFATSGRSTLLIDGDLRLPRLHQYLRLDPSAGLLEYLTGNEGSPELQDIIVGDPSADLRVIVGARRSDTPTDRLVTGRSLNNLFDGARRHFDIVIVDTPPIAPAVDALYLAEHADVVVFVVNWARTSQQNARNSIEGLRGSLTDGAEIVAVLNQERSRSPKSSDYYG